jgi:phosphomannomutase
MKKLIAFDLDGTLAPSKSPLPEKMASQLKELLRHKQVCVISGGKFEQFEKQLLHGLDAPELYGNLHIMPTCGTRYLRYDKTAKKWKIQYSEDLSSEERKKIIEAVEKGFADLGFAEKNTYGPCVEDRFSQISYSALGQDIVDQLGAEGVRLKEEWDPDSSKKRAVRDYVARLIPEFEVRMGGSTTIDVTRLGVDKAYGIRKLSEALNCSLDQVLFIGDRLDEGGNDYPVKAMGVSSIAIDDWTETALIVETLNKTEL